MIKAAINTGRAI